MWYMRIQSTSCNLCYKLVGMRNIFLSLGSTAKSHERSQLATLPEQKDHLLGLVRFIGCVGSSAQLARKGLWE